MVHRNTRGFTLVEILVVVGILALLLAVLVPVVRHAQTSAQATAVKAQLQNLSSGLEMFKADFGYYPSSTPQNTFGVELDQNNAGFPNNLTNDHKIQGFHRMAMALVGRDKLGCPSKRGTGAYPSTAYNGANPGPDSLTGWYYSYTSVTVRGTFDAPWLDYTGTAPANWAAANRTARKNPYINPEGFSIVNDEVPLGANSYLPAICDKLDQKKEENITGTSYANFKRSIPLYFAANPRGQRITTTAVTGGLNNAAAWREEYYLYLDNYQIFAQNYSYSGFPKPSLGFAAGQKYFCNAIEDPKAKVVDDRMPHNKDGYILISPGPDLLHMTKDDIVNWNQ